MKTSEFFAILNKLSIPVAYYSFREDVKLPYCIYFESATVTGSDFKNRVKETHFTIELYDEKRNKTLEDKLETLLDEAGYNYNVSYAIYNDDVKAYESIYDVTIYSKKER